jgi:hypothetical protein
MKEIILENLGIITIEDGIKEFSIEELEIFYNGGIRHIDEESLSLLYILIKRNHEEKEVTSENIGKVLVDYNYFTKNNNVYTRKIDNGSFVVITLKEGSIMVQNLDHNISEELLYSNYQTIGQILEIVMDDILGI